MECHPLRRSDRSAWEVLARGYHAFYGEAFEPGAYEDTWERLMNRDQIFGLGATIAGRLVGVTHCLFHAHVWQGQVCYLQDLYVEERQRGKGVGRALIEAAAEVAFERGAFRIYWTTQENNTTARLLYDRIGQFRGFIRYDISL